MKIYRPYPTTGNKFAFIETSGITEEDNYKILLGQDINIASSNIIVGNKSKVLPDVMGSGLSDFFVSTKVKNLLVSHINEIIFKEVEIQEKQYWLIIPTRILDIIDKERSEIIFFKNGKIDEINSLKYDAQPLNEYDIFRLEGFNIPLFITEKLKNLMEENDITGVEYFSSSALSELE